MSSDNLQSDDDMQSPTLLKRIIENSMLLNIIRVFYDRPRIHINELFSKMGKDDKTFEALNFLISNGFLTRKGNYLKASGKTSKIAYTLKSYEIAKDYLDKIFVDELLPQGNILDLGSGGGSYVACLNNRLKQNFVVGVDIDKDLIYMAKIKNKNGQFLIADAHALPFRDGAFNFILSLLLLPYVDEERVLAEATRALSTRGDLYLRAHGAGLYLKNALKKRNISISQRMFNLFIILNTFTYWLTGRKIFNNVFQSKRRICKMLKNYGVHVIRINDEDTCICLPILWMLYGRKL